jgi:hypothetical protein
VLSDVVRVVDLADFVSPGPVSVTVRAFVVLWVAVSTRSSAVTEVFRAVDISLVLSSATVRAPARLSPVYDEAVSAVFRSSIVVLTGP